MERRTISNRIQRNIRERDRRAHMKNLLLMLASLLPNSSKLSVNDLVDEATSHIQKMKTRLDELEQRKNQALGYSISNNNDHPCSSSSDSNLPILKISSRDSIVEVNLITGLTKNFMLHQVLQILQEEGAQVTSFTSCSNADHLFIYTIQSQAISSRIGIETGKIVERLQELVCS